MSIRSHSKFHPLYRNIIETNWITTISRFYHWQKKGLYENSIIYYYDNRDNFCNNQTSLFSTLSRNIEYENLFTRRITQVGNISQRKSNSITKSSVSNLILNFNWKLTRCRGYRNNHAFLDTVFFASPQPTETCNLVELLVSMCDEIESLLPRNKHTRHND